VPAVALNSALSDSVNSMFPPRVPSVPPHEYNVWGDYFPSRPLG